MPYYAINCNKDNLKLVCTAKDIETLASSMKNRLLSYIFYHLLAFFNHRKLLILPPYNTFFFRSLIMFNQVDGTCPVFATYCILFFLPVALAQV